MPVLQEIRNANLRAREIVSLFFGALGSLIVVFSLVVGLALSLPFVVVASAFYPDERPVWHRVKEDVREWVGLS